MKKLFLLLICCALTHGPLFSQTAHEMTSPFHVSFFPPLSTNGSKAAQYTNGASFNILAGVSKNEKAFAFAGLANIIKNDATGLQFAGLYNSIGNDGKGFAMAGLANRTTNNYYGIQYAGLMNTARQMNGLQFSGIVNITQKEMKGMQFGGITNIAQDVYGVQFAGIVNMAKKVKGAQFALFNIAEENDYPIGLVNIIKNGEKSIGLSYDDTGNALVSFRSGGKVLYGILGVGYNHRSDNEEYALEGGFGAHINIISKFRINTEIKSQYMTSFSSHHISKNSLAVLPAFKILPQLEIFAGPSINYMETDNVNNKNLFPSHSIWKKNRENKLRQCYIGYTVGTHFIF